MSNGHANCILGVCCPPRSTKQKQALAEEMAKALSGTTESYEDIAAWMVNNFDLAPPGSLTAFKTEIARLARENPQGGPAK